MIDAKNKRKPIGKKIRFEVFKRDEFKCLYCGSTPEKSVLQIDHVIPVAEGGGNEIENLVTSCFECNIGKGARLLTSKPESVASKAKILKEQQEQVSSYLSLLHQKKSNESDAVFMVVRELYGDDCDDIPIAQYANIASFVNRLGTETVIEAAMIAVSRGRSPFKYLCGICWRLIKNGGEI